MSGRAGVVGPPRAPRTGIECRLIVSLDRGQPLPAAQELVALAAEYHKAGRGVVGIELSGGAKPAETPPPLRSAFIAPRRAPLFARTDRWRMSWFGRPAAGWGGGPADASPGRRPGRGPQAEPEPGRAELAAGGGAGRGGGGRRGGGAGARAGPAGTRHPPARRPSSLAELRRPAAQLPDPDRDHWCVSVHFHPRVFPCVCARARTQLHLLARRGATRQRSTCLALSRWPSTLLPLPAGAPHSLQRRPT